MNNSCTVLSTKAGICHHSVTVSRYHCRGRGTRHVGKDARGLPGWPRAQLNSTEGPPLMPGEQNHPAASCPDTRPTESQALTTPCLCAPLRHSLVPSAVCTRKRHKSTSCFLAPTPSDLQPCGPRTRTRTCVHGRVCEYAAASN